jgi:hypothetical protein
MVELATTQLQAKGGAPPASREGGSGRGRYGQAPNVPPPPSTDVANRLYHQLVEIHAISAAQLVKCTRWRQSSPTPNMAYAGAGWRGLTVEPSTARIVPPLATSFSLQSLLGHWSQHVESQVH